MKQRFGILIILFAMFSHIAKAFTPQRDSVRLPAVAGKFYPAEPEALRRTVDSLLQQAAGSGAGKPRALIVPHAGYIFSGAVAAEAFAQLAPDASYRRIFLLGPSHRAAFDGASVDDAFAAHSTPLGQVAVDGEVCRLLRQSGAPFTYLPKAHQGEHGIEVQLPFLQRRLRQVPPIVPIVVGSHRLEELQRMAERLRPYFTADNLFVISSDFSHYPAYDDACRVDKETGDAVASGSLERFLQVIQAHAAEQVPDLATSACGQSPLALLLLLMQGTEGLSIRHLAYRNSGDSPYADGGGVVGYHAFAVWEGTAQPEASESGSAAQPFALSRQAKAQLLSIARQRIERALAGDTALTCDTSRLDPVLKQPCGAFVSLHVGGRLRGCIGNLVGRKPLYRTVADMALAAAFEDPRFPPLKADELPGIDIEISVLSPLRRIASADQFQLGRHGILMVKDGRQGTFLPQVAAETGWSKEEFLGHCARDKAGIGWEGWRSAELYVYEAVVFGEKSTEP